MICRCLPPNGIGNVAPGDVLSLETLRLGLRSETVERFALGDLRSAGGD